MKLLLLMLLAWLCALFRLPLPAWSLAIAGFLALATAFSWLASGYLWLAWSAFIVAVVPLNVAPLRRAFVSRPLLERFRNMLPPLSRTEREALEAGTVWWDGELFGGRPDWEAFLALPPARLSPEEQAFLDGPVEDLCRMLDDWRTVAELRDLPPEAWRFIREEGFFGMIIPKEHGGLGFSHLAHSEVIMRIASRSVAAAVTVMVPNSIGPAELLLHYGTDEQKAFYLPRLARGEEVPCFALTGPEAGSDAASIPDTGTVCRGEFGGKETVGIRLTFEKRYITLGPVATVIGLAFRLRDPEHLLGGADEPGITFALVPAGTPGIERGARHDPLGVPFQNGPIRGKDVFIPVEWIVGGAAGAGQGWRMLMEALAAGRGISLPALSTGGAKLVARGIGAYARVRRQFRLPIGRFEGVGEALARIGGATYLLDAARRVTCGALDRGERPAVISSIVKYHATERMRQVINDGMDIQGGSGICLGPRNILGHLYQSAPVGITVEGANILTRSMIIFGQGVVRCHPFVRREMAAAEMAGAQGLAEFDRAIFGHMGFTLHTAARSLFLAVTSGRLERVPEGRGRPYYRGITRLSTAFALVADTALLTLGGSLKRRESISGRLADILGHLYLASAVLKEFSDREELADEWPFVEWGCEDALLAAQRGLEGIMRNFPIRPVAWFLRLLVFPLGRPFAGASDAACQRVAELLLRPSVVRDRLTAGLFIPAGTDETLGRLEDALEKTMIAEPLERRLQEAVKEGRLAKGREGELVAGAVAAGILTDEEADLVRLAAAARSEVIRVDEFSFPQGKTRDEP